MANERHLALLKKGVDEWNSWRIRQAATPDLSGVNLEGADLRNANLFQADLSYANLTRANLVGADLADANLTEANLYMAGLRYVNLTSSVVVRSNMRDAEFSWAIFHNTRLEDPDLTDALFAHTVFANVNLSQVVGLANCHHYGPSSIDFSSLRLSWPLPLPFLRGVGLPDSLIEYFPSFVNQPIQHYSGFISYSTNDKDFTDRLYADLQNKGVRCWFAPHDMLIGARILDEIDAAIRLRDKVLLILSEHSIKSDWVEDEVTMAFEEERTRKQIVLFPIRLDDAVMDTNEPWAAKLRARHIGDFRRWKEHDEYQKSFARVLRDLTVKKP